MTKYEKRVQELENQGLTTSDAQGVADVEFAQKCAFTLLEALKIANRYLDTVKGYKDSSLRDEIRYAISRAEGREEVSE